MIYKPNAIKKNSFTDKMKIGLKLIILIILPFIATNCIKDDECCYPRDHTVLGLKFRYATATDAQQQSTVSQAPLLTVFIFDDKGIFISQMNDSSSRVNDDYIMELPYQKGSYQFVTWADYNENYYQLSARVAGQTRINDFYLFLKREEDNRIINPPQLLYHGIHDMVKIKEGEKNIVWIDLKQITNHIRVIAYNLNENKTNSIYIEDNNGKYGYDSHFADDDNITYIPAYSSSVNNSSRTSPLIADFTVMKLDKSRAPRLKIADETGLVRYDENLIGKLLSKNPSINFDYDHDFTIEISFDNYIPVSIKINGWEIINESV